ncbi:HNH endonuclease [Microbacterium schleiferi]|uniref:DUF222 domain-containing protein n=1 Tax=Microbacterium schleiferi TaxID=69362 RepID=A0ABU7V7M4_9MICO|nr:DUF222 domain-containing protein [Micrococcales bacterium]
MSSNVGKGDRSIGPVIGYTDADLGALCQIVADFEDIEVRAAREEVARVRVLARAGQLARKQARGQTARVRAHDMALRSIALELGAASRVSDRSMQRQINDAVQLVEDYPTLLAARETGSITRQHVSLVVEAGAPLPADVRAEFDRLATERCLTDSANRVRASVMILAERMHPRTPQERHQEAREGRAVRIRPLSDGMSEVCAPVPTVIAVGIDDRLTQMARAVIDSRPSPDATEQGPDVQGNVFTGDTRTMDQIRADLFAQLLLAGSPVVDPAAGDGPGPLGAIRAKVQVVVPALALAGTETAGPADLVGHSPIDPETARELAAGATWWERLVTHPVNGSVLAADGYARPAALNRWLRARDQHCRTLGCRIPAIRCEVDHNDDYATGGRTEHGNLCHFCQRHHSMKQFTAWQVQQLDGGILQFTSPTGRIYTDHPPPVSVHFTPDEPPSSQSDPAPF